MQDNVIIRQSDKGVSVTVHGAFESRYKLYSSPNEAIAEPLQLGLITETRALALRIAAANHISIAAVVTCSDLDETALDAVGYTPLRTDRND